METILNELRRYVGFGDADEAALRALHPFAKPHFAEISETFYDRILAHPEARRALEGGESTVGRLKITLQAWMDLLLRGPWDDVYYETRARIGRVHVRIALPPHYMFGAMNVIRRELTWLVDQQVGSKAEESRARREAVGKVLDLELAIMLHTYREDLLSQQARVERLSTFGQLVGSIGHELRNPLGVMESSLYILKSRIGDDPRATKHADRIGDQLALANRIISNLLDMIRDRPLAVERLSVATVVQGAASSVTSPPGVRVVRSGFENLAEVLGDPTQLRQVFLNLIENAVQAVGATGEVRIAASALPGRVEISVEDTGPGLDAAMRARLFEPLNTTKKAGIGLGLALVKRIVERHNGTIRYEPHTAGARFVVGLPTA